MQASFVLKAHVTNKTSTWLHEPQRVQLRKALFQIHLWAGVGLGLYIFFMSLTGSVLVYRNELYRLATSERAFMLVSTLIDLHDNFLAGSIGRTLNGIGGVAVMIVALTGLVIWWPGIGRWQRSLTLHRGVGWRIVVRDLHNMVGIWCAGFILVFALSGIYLCFPDVFHNFADRVEPFTEDNAESRISDEVLYWLAYLHFGRVNGIGIFCSQAGVCDQIVKAAWAIVGLAPAIMFATGATMW